MTVKAEFQSQPATKFGPILERLFHGTDLALVRS